ncbi:MAG: hypothetical protein PVI38_10725, partial [Desulfobacterales bacterium]
KFFNFIYVIAGHSAWIWATDRQDLTPSVRPIDYQPLFMYHGLSYRRGESLLIGDCLPFHLNSMVEHPSR